MLINNAPTKALLTAVTMLAFTYTACQKSSEGSPQEDMTRDVSKEVAVVGKSFWGGSGAPVLVLEETHNSRASLIEHAIVLTRLYAHYGVRDIALEGYLKDGPRIDASWFTDRHGTSAVDRSRVAVRLLKEGEISAPEFSKLVYPNVNLMPAEISSQYEVSMSEGALDAALDLAQRISPSKGEEVNKKLEEAVKNPLSAEEQLKMAEELEKDRVSRNIVLPQKSLDDWRSWLGFWRGRAGGNNTMLGTVLSAPTDSTSRPVVMNVGAAHTEGLCRLLAAASRSYAVITPLALRNKDKRGEIDHNYSLKENRRSVQPDGIFMSAINAATAKKPEPDLNEPWMHAKALTYQFADRIANGIVGPPSPPGGGKPPYDFSDGAFDDQWVRVDPHMIAIVPDGDRKAVLFPIVLNPYNRKRTKTFWIKAIVDHQAHLSTSAGDDAALVEAMLKDVLSQVQSEQDAPSQAEDSAGTILVSDNVRAVFAPTKEDAMARSLRATS